MWLGSRIYRQFLRTFFQLYGHRDVHSRILLLLSNLSSVNLIFFFLYLTEIIVLMNM